MSPLAVLNQAAQARIAKRYNILLAHHSTSVGPHEDVRLLPPNNSSLPKKRKRQPISYAEIDSDDDMIYQSDEEYDCPAAARKKAKGLPTSKIFPFLSLPRELRDHIYHHSLVDTLGGAYIDERLTHHRRTPVRIATGPPDTRSYWGARCPNGAMPLWRPPRKDDPDAPPASSPHSQTLVSALLRVCKQLHAEAAPLLYAQPLYFADGRALHTFLAALAPPTRALLRDITLLEDYSWRRRSTRRLDGPAFDLLADGGGVGTGLVRLRLGDLMGEWLKPSRNDSTKAGVRRFYRSAWKWLEAMRRGKGVEEAVKVVQVIDHDYKVWKVGGPDLEDRDVFWTELKRLIEATRRNW